MPPAELGRGGGFVSVRNMHDVSFSRSVGLAIRSIGSIFTHWPSHDALESPMLYASQQVYREEPCILEVTQSEVHLLVASSTFAASPAVGGNHRDPR